MKALLAYLNIYPKNGKLKERKFDKFISKIKKEDFY